MLIDTHCHIQFNAYKDDADEVIKKCVAKNIILNAVGSQKDTSIRAVEYARKYDNIYATVGLHPVHLCSTEVDEEEVKFKTREEVFDYDFYKQLASDPKVIAIGECGLELFHLPENLHKDEVLKIQKDAFILQYKLAQEMGLPMVIHVREAHEEMLELLSVIASPANAGRSNPSAITKGDRRVGLWPPRDDRYIRGVVHCFTGDWAQAQKYLDLGLYLGFTGIITFPPKKSDPKPQLSLLEVVEKCPLERILIETDAPYLAPNAYRGKRAEPWMVEEVVKKIAEVRGISVSEVEKITAKNAKKLFTRLNLKNS